MATVAKVSWTHAGVSKTAWVVRYKDGAGIRRQRKCPSKKAADTLRLKIENEIERGEHVAASQTVTVNELCDLYLSHDQKRVADGRIGRTRALWVEGQLKPVRAKLGSRKLTELTPGMIESFYADQVVRSGEGALARSCRPARHQGLVSPKTAKDRVRLMKLLQDFAIKRRLMASRPVTEALIELRGTAPAPKIATFSVEEIGRLVNAAMHRDPRKARASRLRRSEPMMECALHLATFCGLRWGEIAGLRLQDIDFDRRVLMVRQSFNPHSGIKAPKTKAGVRDVPLPAHMVPLLRDWIAEHHIANALGLVLQINTGEPLGRANFHQNLWRPLLRRAGLLDADTGRTFHFHALRHFAASAMISSGLPMPDVANLLGHAKFDMTLQVYAHPMYDITHRQTALDRMATAIIAAPITIDVAVQSLKKTSGIAHLSGR